MINFIFLVRVSAVGAKHSRRTALGEISKNKPKSSFASIKPALKSSKTSAGRVNVFQVTEQNLRMRANKIFPGQEIIRPRLTQFH